MSWKNQGGHRSNRNIKASTVLFKNSNFWQKGDDLEIFHNNDGATARIGLGTNEPHSRLSLGNTAKFGRPGYANNANIALCENSDGTAATGIGFYEKYKDDDATTGVRNFSGIKFIVNNDFTSQNTIDIEDNHNVKMLIRDDGKVLIAHNPNETRALESYNIAALDVSGSIRTTDFLILGKHQYATGYRPGGSIRYTGKTLVFTNEEGNDLTVKTTSDVGKSGDWGSDTAQRPGGDVHTVYLGNQIKVGVLKNLYDPDMFHQQFQVEGVVGIGDQAFLKQPMYSGTVISDISADGLLVVQHNIGINTYLTEALLDINTYDKPLLKIGLAGETSAAKNSVAIGRSVNVTGEESWGWGRNINISANNSLAFGNDNNIFFSERCYVIGKGNTISNANGSRHSFAFGTDNKIFDTSGAILMGHNNVAGPIDGTENLKADQSICMGINNYMFSKVSFIHGTQNVTEAGNYNFLTGKNNRIINCESSSVYGKDHILDNSSNHTVVYGISNNLVAQVHDSLITGRESKFENASGIMSFGYQNEVSGNTLDTLVGGSQNKSFNTLNSGLFGSNNQVNNASNIVLGGYDNKIENCFNSTAYGTNNNIDGVSNSIIAGSNNNLKNNSNNNSNNIFVLGENFDLSGELVNSLIGGENHYIEKAHNIIVFGKGHTIIDPSFTFVYGINHNIQSDVKSVAFGEENTLSGGSSNSIFGTKNTGINLHDSFITGGNNTAMNSSKLFIYGDSNTVDGNQFNTSKHSNNSLLGGKNNITYHSTESSVFGTSNNIRDASSSLITGDSNIINDSNNSIASGVNNQVQISHNSILSGDSNIISNSTDSLLIGKDNTIDNAQYLLSFGENNISQNSKHSFIGGYNNTVTNATGNITFGYNNVLDTGYLSLFFGEENQQTTGKRDALFGHKNIINNADNSIISGDTNTLKDCSNNILVGQDNIIEGNNNSFVSGKNNSLTGIEANGLLIIGGDNTVTGKSINSLIGGTNNTVSNVKDNISFGKNHNINNMDLSLYLGEGHTLEDGSHNTVMGLQNSMYRTKQALITGRKNVVKDTIGAVIFGQNNDMSGNSNDVLLGGHYNKGFLSSASALFGTSNLINDVSNSIISGNNNTMGDCSNNFITGNNNTINGNSDSFISGINNKITGNHASAVMVYGNMNEISGITKNSLIGGSNNKAHNVEDNLSFGKGHDIKNMKMSLFMGKENVLDGGEINTVMGKANTLKNSQLSLITGKNNTVEDTIGTITYGENNNVSANSNHVLMGGNINSSIKSTASAVFGTFNTLNDTSNVIIAGEFNTLSDCSNNILVGYNNNITGNSNSYVSGTNNTLTGTEASGMLIFGDDNTVSGSSLNSLVGGTNNTVSNVKNNMSFGSNQTINNQELSMYMGTGHLIEDGSHNAVFGKENTLSNTFESLSSGNNNKISDSNRGLISGINNEIKNNSDNSIVTGDSNIVSNSKNSYLLGKENTMSIAVNGIATGSKNDLTRANDSFVTGENNRIYDSSSSSIYGKENNIYHSKHSFATGYKNNLDKTENIIAAGSWNDISQNVINSLLTGDYNKGNNSKSVSIQGSKNSIKDSDNSLIAGVENKIEMNTNSSIAAGINNLIKASVSSFVNGTDNTMNSLIDSMTIGNNNYTTNSTNSFVSGQSNILDDASGVLLVGESNVINIQSGNTIVGGHLNSESKGHFNLTVGLKNTIDDSKSNNTTGESNKVVLSNNNQISGYKNELTNSNQNIVNGYENVVKSSNNSFLFGKTNTMENMNESIIGGNTNTVDTGNYISLFGDNNIVKNTDRCIITGKNNDIELGETNALFGENNEVNTSVSNVSAGKSNKVLNSNYNLQSGEANELIQSEKSIMVGEMNKLTIGTSNAVFGIQNELNEVDTSIISGKSNTITASNRIFTYGENNVANNLSINSLLGGDGNVDNGGSNNASFGTVNSITNTKNTILVGNNNTSLTSNSNIFMGKGNDIVRGDNTIIGGDYNNLTDGSNNSVYGSANEINKSSNNLITGKQNSMSVNTSGSAGFGELNTLENVTNSMIIGSNNSIKDSDNMFVTGQNNDVSGSSINSLLGGFNNHLFNASNNLVFGKNNKVLTANVSLFFGENNKIVSGDYNAIFGKNNEMDVVKESVTIGSGNIIKSSDGVMAFGHDNRLTSSNDSLIGGKNSTINQSKNIVISGENNIIDASPNSIVMGKDNNLQISSSSMVGGENNNINTGDYNTVFGVSNELINASYSLMAGGQNKLDGNYNAAFGHKNEMTNTLASYVSGEFNKTTGGAHNMNFGRNNELNNVNEGLMTGVSNTIKNSDRIVTFGKDNIIEENTTDSLIGGVGHKVKKTTHTALFGKNNEVTEVNYSIINGENNKITVGLNNVICGKDNVMEDVTEGLIIGRNNTMQSVSNSFLLGTNCTLLGVQDGIALGSHAILDGDDIFALGSAFMQDNVLIINKYGDMHVGRHIFGDYEEDKKIFTDISQSSITIGGHSSSVIIGNDMNVTNDLVIGNNLTVKGLTTYIHSRNLDISDNIILLNKGIGNELNAHFSSGILVQRKEPNVFMGWDQIQNSFLLGETDYDGGKDISDAIINKYSDLRLNNILLSGDIMSDIQEDKSIFAEIDNSFCTIEIGAGGTRTKIGGTNSLVLPVGATDKRVQDDVGSIRFNTTTKIFEGYNYHDTIHQGWVSMQGVMDVDRDTYITAENKANEDNDELRFFTDGLEQMRINEYGNVGIQERFNGSDPYNHKVSLHVGGTNAIHIPTGTTLERPDADSSFEQGYIRYNTTKEIYEGFGAGMKWRPLSSGYDLTDLNGDIIAGTYELDKNYHIRTNYQTRVKILEDGKIGMGIEHDALVAVDIKAADGLKVPCGTTAERPFINEQTDISQVNMDGVIRYNRELERFEGYNGRHWISLSTVEDVDGDTKITVENRSGTDTDQIKFHMYDISHNKKCVPYTFDADRFILYNWDTGLESIMLDASNGNVAITGDLKLGQGDALANMKVGAVDAGINNLFPGSTYSSTLGRGNIVRAGNFYSTIFGYINEILDTQSSFIFGEYNYMRETNSCVTIGRYNTNNHSTASLIGGTNMDAERNDTVMSYAEKSTYKDSKWGDVIFGISHEVINSENSLVYGRQNNIDGNKGVLSGGRHIIGKNSENSIVIGEKITLNKSINSGIFGEGHNIQRSRNMLVSGSSNISIDSSGVQIFGNMNDVLNETKLTQVNGKENLVDDVDFGFIQGLNNKSTSDFNTMIIGKENITNFNTYSSVLGKNNELIDTYITNVNGSKNIMSNADVSIVSGNDNTIVDISYGLVMGHTNTLERNAYTIANGDELDISDVWKSLIYGKSNVIRESNNNIINGNNLTVLKSNFNDIIGNHINALHLYNSRVSGDSHVINNSTHSNIGGSENNVKNVDIVNVQGNLNILDKDTNLNVVGTGNVTQNNSISNVLGLENILTDISLSTVKGMENVITNSNIIDVNGEKNEILDSSKSNIIGTQNELHKTINSEIIGKENEITDISNSLIIGEGNYAQHIYGTTVTGVSNEVINVYKSFIAGSHNNIRDGEYYIALGQEIDISGVDNAVALGYKAKCVGDTRFAIGTRERNGNIFTIDKNGTSTFGRQNTSIDVNDSFLSGTMNDISNCDNIITSGSQNKVRGITNSIVAGHNNMLIDGSNNVAFGENCTIIDMSNSVALGAGATCRDGVSFAFGSNAVAGNLVEFNDNGDLHIHRNLNSAGHGPKGIFIDHPDQEITIGGQQGRVIIGELQAINLVSDKEEDKTLYADISQSTISIGRKRARVYFGGTNSIRLPVGKTNERPSLQAMGSIRYNKTKRIFEGYGGYDGAEWHSLVGVQDNDQDTYITTETSLGSDEDTFTFYNNDKKSLTLDEDTFKIYNDNNVINFMVEKNTGELNFTGDAYIGGDIYGIVEEDKRIFTDISQSTITLGSLNSKVKIGGTNSLVLPCGTTVERIDDIEGAVRYNKTKKTFEGYSEGSEWLSLVGVQDSDQDTYITTETSLGSNEDTFTFYTGGIANLTLSEFSFNLNDKVVINNEDGNITTKGNIECEKNLQVFGDIDLSKNINIGEKILALQPADVEIFTNIVGEEDAEGDQINNLITVGGYQDGDIYDNDPNSDTYQTYITSDLYSSKTLINGYLDVEKDVLLKRNLYIGGHTQLQTISIWDDLHCNRNLFVDDDINLDGDLNLLGDIKAYPNAMGFITDKTIFSNLDFYRTITIGARQVNPLGGDRDETYWVGPKVNIEGYLNVASNTALENKVRIDGWLDCSGITSNLNIYAKEFLHVDKDINLKRNLIITGDLISDVENDKQIFTDIIQSKITIGSVHSEIILDGHLNVKKTSKMEGDVEIWGSTTTEEIIANENITAKKDVIVVGDVDVSQNITVQGKILSGIDEDKEIFTNVENSTITIGAENSVTLVDGTLNVARNATIFGDLHVQGTRTVVHTKNVDISDNIIIINDYIGELAVPYDCAGIMIKRKDPNAFMGWSEIDQSFILAQTTTNAEADLVVEDFIPATLKCSVLNITDSAFVKNHISTDDMSANLITVVDLNITDTAFYKDYMYFDYNADRYNPYFGWDISNSTFELAKADKDFDIKPAALVVDEINVTTANIIEISNNNLVSQYSEITNLHITNTAFWKDYMYFDYMPNETNPFFGWDKHRDTFFMGKTTSYDGYFDMDESSSGKLFVSEYNGDLVDVNQIVANDVSSTEVRVSKIKINEYAYFGDYEVDNAFIGWDNEEKTFIMGKFDTEYDEWNMRFMNETKFRVAVINSDVINVVDLVAKDISSGSILTDNMWSRNYSYFGDYEVDNAFMAWDNDKYEFVLGKFEGLVEKRLDAERLSKMSDVRLRVGEVKSHLGNITHINNDTMISNRIDVSSVNITDVAYFNDYVYFNHIDEHPANPIFGWNVDENAFVMGLTDSEKGKFQVEYMDPVKFISNNIQSDFINVKDLNCKQANVTDAIVKRLDVTDVAYFEDNLVFNQYGNVNYNPFMGWDSSNNTFVIGKIDLSNNRTETVTFAGVSDVGIIDTNHDWDEILLHDKIYMYLQDGTYVGNFDVKLKAGTGDYTRRIYGDSEGVRQILNFVLIDEETDEWDMKWYAHNMKFLVEEQGGTWPESLADSGIHEYKYNTDISGVGELNWFLRTVKQNPFPSEHDKLDQLTGVRDNKLTVADIENKRTNITERLDVREHAEFHEKLNANNVDCSGRVFAPDYFFPNPDTNSPEFSLQDLIGPPKKIVVIQNTENVLSLQLEVIPSRRYLVGFRPEPLPQINTLTVAFRDGLNVLKEWTLLPSDVGNYDLIRYYKFSKKDRQDYFDANTETYYFYNVPALQAQVYNVVLTFHNYHPSSYPSIFGNLLLEAFNDSHRPNKVQSLTTTVSNPSNNGSQYTENEDISTNLLWINPGSDNEGDVNRYTIEYEEIDSLNNHDFDNQEYPSDPKREIKTIGPIYANELIIDNSNNNFLYGTKYRYRINTFNDIDADSLFTEWFETPEYTSVPLGPQQNTIEVSLKNWLQNRRNSNPDAWQFVLVDDGYSHYNNSGDLWSTYNDDDRPIFYADYSPDLIDFTCNSNDIRIHEGLTFTPDSQNTVSFTVSITDLSNNVYDTENVEYTNIQNRFLNTLGPRETDNIKFVTNVVEKYNSLNTDDQTDNKFKYWLRGDIDNLQLRTQANRTQYGEPLLLGGKFNITVNGENNKQIVKVIPYHFEILTTLPVVSANIKSPWEILCINSNFAWNCGITSLTKDSYLEFSFNISNLASKNNNYRKDVKQASITSDITEDLDILGHDISYGVYKNSYNNNSYNEGLEIVLNEQYISGFQFKDTNAVGQIPFTVTGYNIKGQSSRVINVNLLFDKFSITSPLRDKRLFTIPGDITYDNIPTGYINPFNNEAALQDHELLVFEGIYDSNSANYIDYTLSPYNPGLFPPRSNLSWDNNTYKYAVFSLSNIAPMNSGSISIKIITPENNGFTTHPFPEPSSSGFKFEILLPSQINHGDHFWFNANKNYEDEENYMPGINQAGVTGIGIFESKEHINNTETIFKLRPPRLNNPNVTPVFHIRIGLIKDSPVSFSNIEIMSN